MIMKRVLISTPFLALCIYSNTSSGFEYELTAAAALEHSDNVLLTRDQKRSDTEQRIELGASLQEESRLFQADVDYNAQFSDYKNNVIEDQTFIEGQATAVWSPLPQVFSWEAFTSSHNLRSNRRNTDTLANRRSRTIFSTGPVYQSRLSSVDTVRFSARYTTTNIEDLSPSDNESISAAIDWNHDLSATRQLTAGVAQVQTEFDQANQPDIENNSAYVGFSSALSNSRMRIRAGYNESNRDNLDSVSGPLLEFAYEYTPVNQQITFVAVNVITDSTVGLGNNTILIDENIEVDDSNFDSVDVVERLYSELQYSNSAACSACTLTGLIAYDDQDFDIQPRDETSLRAELSFQYKFTTTLNGETYASRESIDFKNSNREDDVDNIGLRVRYSATRSVVVFAEANYQERESSIDTLSYDETSGTIGVRYTFR